MKPFVRILSIAAFALTLSACETVEGIKQDLSDISFDGFTTATSVNEDPQAQFLTDGDCPTVQIVNELGRLHEFNAGQSMTSGNLVSSVEMNEANSTCTYSDRSVTVDLKLEFDGKLGPKGRRASNEKPFFTYPFFVAVTNANGKILAKEIFAASMTYEQGQNDQIYFETLRQIIPSDTRAQGRSYKIMVGFQLAEKQLEYNRSLIAAEIEAAKKLEMERIAAEEAAAMAAKDAEMKAKEKAMMAKEETITIEQTTNSNPAPIAAPEPARAGPFDIFKTNDE